MIRPTIGITVMLVMCSILCCNARAQLPIIKYNQPATDWESEALPIGNGRLGAMVFGGIETEHLALNEDTLWSGGPKEWDNPEAPKILPKIREALANEDYALAETLTRQIQGPYNQSAMPLGDLWIDFDHPEGEVERYQRCLDLSHGQVIAGYKISHTSFVRIMTVSQPDQAVVVYMFVGNSKFGEDKSLVKPMNFTVRLDSKLRYETQAPGNNELIMTGQAPSHVEPNYRRDIENPIVYEDGPDAEGMRFQTNLRVIDITKEATITPSDDGRSLRVKGAKKVKIFLTADTSYNGFDKSPGREGVDPTIGAEYDMRRICLKREADSSSIFFDAGDDHRELFNRVKLRLGPIDNELEQMPTDERLKRYAEGNEDPGLEALLFQYGRYLMIASSRPGTQPIHLQGIWNDKMRPPWSDNMTMNINVQMSYWPAEVCNLSECHEPLFRMLKECSVTGAKTARTNYDCDGWLTHHNVDLWRQTAPVGDWGEGNPKWANWPMGGVWTCQHLMEHYRFTGDKTFLRDEAYPLMKGAAEFCLDWLYEDEDGHLITGPSTSPENTFILPNDKSRRQYTVTEATTMDISLIWNLFSDLIEASEVLDVDPEFRAELVAKREKLYPLKIGQYGQLQEWNQDWDRLDDHHRHMSHLVGMYPGNRILTREAPELAAAVMRSMEIRETGQNVGWSVAWKIPLGARLLKPEWCRQMIRQNITRNVLPNLLGKSPPMIMDSNFGYTAGIAEMLVQSHAGYVELLPALPEHWSEGEVSGLCARGGFELEDMRWKDGKLQSVAIRSKLGNRLKLRYGEQMIELDTEPGQTLTFDPQLQQQK